MAPPIKKGKARNGRFVILIGDEGAILVYLQGKKVVRRLFAASPEPSNTRSLLDALSSDTKAPVSLLIDMIDQSFVRQTLPPVTQFSVGKLIKRRLDRDFAADDIKGAIILGREKGGRKDWNYMMVSLANTPLLSKWIDLVSERPNPFGGIFLLPIEAEQYVKSLVDSQAIKSDSEWQLLVSHNKVSGFRQVVLQKGKIVFTRMAQPIGDSLPDVIAGNIEQEIMNTSEYLKRLGYSDQAGLDIHIVVAEDIKASLDTAKIKCTNVHIFTPYEVATGLALEQAAQVEDHFGDVVFATHFGSAKKHTLSLQTKYTEKLSTLVTANKAIRGAAALFAFCIIFLIGQSALEAFETYQATKELETQKAGIEKTLEETKKIASQVPGNNEKIADVVSVYELFNKAELSPYWFINKVRNTLADNTLVQTISWNLSDPLNVKENEDKRVFSATIKVSFLFDEKQPKQLGLIAEEYVKRFEKEFEGFKVTHSPIPGLLEDNEALTLTDNPSGQQSSSPLQGVNTSNSMDFTVVSSPSTGMP